MTRSSKSTKASKKSPSKKPLTTGSGAKSRKKGRGGTAKGKNALGFFQAFEEVLEKGRKKRQAEKKRVASVPYQPFLDEKMKDPKFKKAFDREMKNPTKSELRRIKLSKRAEQIKGVDLTNSIESRAQYEERQAEHDRAEASGKMGSALRESLREPLVGHPSPLSAEKVAEAVDALSSHDKVIAINMPGDMLLELKEIARKASNEIEKISPATVIRVMLAIELTRAPKK